MPSVIIVGYVRHILGTGDLFGPKKKKAAPKKKGPPSIGLKSCKAFQTTLCE